MVKLSRKDFMVSTKFWSIIESIDKSKSLDEEFHNYKIELEKLSKEELLGFEYWINYFFWDSYNSELWAAAFIVIKNCRDDKFDYFRHWLITRGKEVYYNALTDAESLIFELNKIAKGDSPQFKKFPQIVNEVYTKKYAEPFLDEIKKYEDSVSIDPINLDWDETEECLKNKYPKLFNDYWQKYQ